MLRTRMKVVGLGALLTAVAACSEGTGTTSLDQRETVMLSDTSVISGTPAQGMINAMGAETAITYIALRPDAVANATSAMIINQRSGDVRAVWLTDGGFDPVAIQARAGDTVITRIAGGVTSEPVTFTTVVPAKRRPSVVRTIPTRRKKDVPLNTRITVVFSEPIDPASVTPSAIRLMLGTVPVAGTLQVPDSAGLTVRFVPADDMLPGSTYHLLISDAVRDRDGDPVEPTDVEFSTEGSPASGAMLAYFGYNGIYVAQADGRFPTRIHTAEVQAGHRGLGLTWSPDGSRIAFAVPRFRQLNTPGAGIFIANRDGSGAVALIRPAGVADDIQPAWAPDGSRIAFVRWGGNGNDLDPSMVLHVVRSDGSGLITLSGSGERPAWSPDGRQIAFTKRDGIYVINLDGTGLRRLTTDGDEAAWSPNGTTILFASQRGGNLDIYAMNPDGSNVRRLTTNGADDRSPQWSPDGGRIVFTREASGWDDLYVMNADGSDVIQLTSTPAIEEVWPAYSPGPIAQSSSLALESAPGSHVGRQIDTVFAALKPFEVRVLRNGVPAADVTVSWTISGGNIATAQTTTDSLGRASVVATLAGPVPEWLHAEATVAGAIGSPVVFQAAGTPGQPARIRFDGQWRSEDGIALALLGGAMLHPSVETTDAHDNVVLGIRVDFAVVSGAGSASPVVDTTAYWQDDEGYCGAWCVSAYTNYAVGPGPGPHSISATASVLPGRPSVTFTAIPVSAIVSFGGDEVVEFTPSTLTVAVGATVGWRLWNGGQDHNLAFEDATPSNSSRTGRLHTRSFSEPGVYRYRCPLHTTGFGAGEVGIVTVR